MPPTSGRNQLVDPKQGEGGHRKALSVSRTPERGDPIAQALPRRSLDAPHKGDPVTGPRPKEVTILLAEDCDDLRALLQMYLESKGFGVLHAENGRQALRIYEQHGETIHLLVTDLMMPEMGGLELAESLRTLHPHMSVLYMSGRTREMGPFPNRLDPGNAFLQKPFALKEMVGVIRQLLDGH
jgi:two-component system cell cycle sensor histidine kinase/response regulator CckA